MKLLEQPQNPNNTPRWAKKALFILALTLSFSGIWFSMANPVVSEVTYEDPEIGEFVIETARLSTTELINVHQNDSEPIPWGKRATLVVVFSPADCPSCLSEIRHWQLLAMNQPAPEFQVVGIVVRSSIDESREFIRAYQPAFPLFFDHQRRVEQMIHFTQDTPIKFLFNSKRSVLLVQGPNNDPTLQEQFADQVRKLILRKA